jgi:hypothetical protein
MCDGFAYVFLSAFKGLVMKKKFALMPTYFLLFALLLGCQTTDPHDLRFESVESVRLSELPRVWNAVQARSDAKTAAITLLKINFSSQFDFVKLAKADTLHVSYRAFRCGNGSVQGLALFVLPDLRIKNLSTGGGYAETSDLERFRESNGRFTYHVLMPIAGDELNRLFGNGTVPGQAPYFNPSPPLSDICLQVVAAAMWFGTTLQSKFVRVSAPEVSRLTK